MGRIIRTCRKGAGGIFKARTRTRKVRNKSDLVWLLKQWNSGSSQVSLFGFRWATRFHQGCRQGHHSRPWPWCPTHQGHLQGSLQIPVIISYSLPERMTHQVLPMSHRLWTAWVIAAKDGYESPRTVRFDFNQPQSCSLARSLRPSSQLKELQPANLFTAVTRPLSISEIFSQLEKCPKVTPFDSMLTG